VFNDPLGSVPTVHLSFHLDEHYNSVRRGDDPCFKGISPIEEYPIGWDLNQIKELIGKSDSGPPEHVIYALRMIDKEITDQDNITVMSEILSSIFTKNCPTEKQIDNKSKRISAEFEQKILEIQFNSKAKIFDKPKRTIDKDYLA